MNRIFRTLFNRCLGLWQVVPETARAQGKTKGSRTADATLGGSACLPYSLLCSVLALSLLAPSVQAQSLTGTGSNSWSLDIFTYDPWVTEVLTAGYDAPGTITIAEGAELLVASSGIYVGAQAEGDGTLIITDPGTTVSLPMPPGDGTVAVGYRGTGRLFVENGAALSADRSVYIGAATGATGTATITGAGSHLEAGREISVGNYGSGTLNIGAYDLSDTAGTVSSPLISSGSGGTLNFNQTDSTTLASNIEGNINLHQRGTGTTTLTGSNSYTGSTTISDGALIGNTGSLPGDILNNASLVFDQATDGSYASVVSGSGNLFKRGTGTLTLTGTHSYTGETTIEQGTLRLAGGGSISHGASEIYIGNVAGQSARLEIAAGSSLETHRSSVGGGGGTGSVSVSGAGAQWLVNENLYLAEAEMEILEGGRVDVAALATIGNGGEMSLTVDGTGSVLQAEGLVLGRDASSGTLTLQNGGEAIVSVGTLRMGGEGTLNFGAYDLGAATTAGTLTAGSIAINGTINFNQTDTLTLAQNIVQGFDGPGRVNQRGTGTTILSGANTYRGGTQISGGTLSVGSDANLGQADTTVTMAGGTLHANSSFTSSDRTMVFAAGTTSSIDAGGNTLTWGGDFTGSTGDWVKTGTGTLRLTGSDGTSGSVTLNEGNLWLDDPTGSNTLINGDFIVGDGIGGSGNAIASLLQGSQIGSGTVTVNADGLLDNQHDEFLSNLVLNSGLVRTGASGSLGISNSLTMTGGIIHGSAVLMLNADTETLASADTALIRAPVSLGGAARSFTVADGSAATDLEIENVVFNGAITKLGEGTMVLSGANTYSGGTSISGGTLSIGNDANLGQAGSSVTMAGGTLHANSSFTSSDRTLVFSAGTTSSIDVEGGSDVFWAGDFTGSSGDWLKTGLGYLQLTGADGTSGTVTVAEGALALNDSSSSDNLIRGDLFVGDGLGVGGSAVVSLVGSSQIGAGTVTVNQDGLLDNQSDEFVSNLVLDSGHVRTGWSGSLGISNSLTMTGGEISGDAVLMLNADTETLASSETALISAPVSMDSFTHSFTVADGSAVTDLHISGGISNGTGGLTKLGGGTMRLSGNSIYSGDTLISAGVLDIQGSIDDSEVTIQAGATLKGTGSVGSLVIADGGILAPGNSPGTLDVVGDLTLNSGSISQFELDTAGVVGGGVNDLVAVGGNLTLDGQIDLIPQTNFGAGEYTLFTYGGTLVDNQLSFDGSPVAWDLAVDTATSGEIKVNVSAAVAQYWDGTDTASDNLVDGGSATWNAATTNWTSAKGNNNNAWDGSLAAIFTGTAGTVTIADGYTAQADALSFLSDGYLIDAAGTGELQLSGPAIVEVQGTATEAQIAATISGTSGLEKTGLGTLILAGDNTYSGGTLISNGTLQVGNGGTSGSIAGDVSNQGQLIFNRSDDFSFTGTISGTGALIKNGSGTLVLSGNNSYSGGTEIAAGSLQGNTDSLQGDILNDGVLVFDQGSDGSFDDEISGSGSLNKTGSGRLILTGNNSYTGGTTVSTGILQGNTDSLQGDILNNGVLVFDQGSDGSFVDEISGSGSLNKTGSGRLILTGNNSYTGGTTVSAGTLQGNTDSLQGNIQNNAQLNFNQATDGTYTGMLGGSGSLTKLGAGTLTLTGSNSYSGGTLISTGILQGNTDSLQGNIQNSAQLNFNQSTDGTFAGMLSGNGSFTKFGSGTLTLTGNSSFDGAMSVSEGMLVVDGSLASTVQLHSGTRLGGNGIIGGLIVQDGATVAPGNSIGTLNIDGNWTLAGGATYEVELIGGGNTAGSHNDFVAVTGLAIIEDGAKIHITPENGSDDGRTGYAHGETYTLFNADGGLTVNGNQVISDDYAYLDFTTSHNANAYYLTSELIRVDSNGNLIDSFCLDGMGQNQCTTGTSTFQLGSGHSIYDQLLNMTEAQAARTLTELSADIHASSRSLLIEQNSQLRQTALHRVRFNEEDGGWIDLFGDRTEFEDSNSIPGLKGDSFGFLTGADYQLDNQWRLGGFAGYSDNQFEQHSANNGESDSLYLGGYANRSWGALNVNLGLSYGWHTVETERRAINQTLEAEYDAYSMQAFAETSYHIALDNGWLQPFIELALVEQDQESFKETGGIAALNVSADKTETGFTTLGMRAGHQFTFNKVSTEVYSSISWRHAFLDVESENTQHFVNSDYRFQVVGIPVATNSGLFELGLGMQLSESTRLTVNYRGNFADDSNIHTVNAQLGVAF